MSNCSFQVLGSSSATPTKKRFPTAHLLKVDGRFFLLDCGEGAQIQLKRFGVRFQRIEKIFITHLHGDHYYGLIGLLNSFHLLGREKPLIIYGPKGLREILDVQLQITGRSFNYSYEIEEWNKPDFVTIFEDDKVRIDRFPLKHGIPCCGYYFTIKPGKLKVNQERIQELKIPLIHLGDIQKGNDYVDDHGNIIANKELTLPPRPAKRIAYCTDTKFVPELAKQLESPDLLYHESTFLNKDLDRAKETNHSTAEQAATFAKICDAKKLILSHFSARYKNVDPFLEEACKIFKNTILAEDGLEVDF